MTPRPENLHKMKHLVLAAIGLFAISAIVFVVSVVQLIRMRYGARSRRRRHRSYLSWRRARLYISESLFGIEPSLTVRSARNMH